MTAPTIRPLTVEEFSVLRPYARGTDMSAIAKATGYHLDKVTAVIVDRTNMNRHHAAELVRQHMYDNPPAAATPPTPIPPPADPIPPAPIVTVKSAMTRMPEPPAPEPVAPSSLDAILTAAEAHPHTRIRTIAVKVRTQLETLRVRLAEDERARLANAEQARAYEAARKRVQTLARQLAEARAALHPVAPKVHLKTAVAADSEAQRVRRWAADNDISVSHLGKIANATLAAYRAAHPTGEG